MSTWGNLWREFWSDESGQDIVEYALLAALVGIASIVTWQGVAASVNTLYTSANTGVQGLSACTPDPGGGGC
jgi:Flp pilus assembly pilin Flp